MAFRLAINGYGRIGRSILRAYYETGLCEPGHKADLELVAINELADIQTIAHLTQYDSTHGRFRGDVSYRDEQLEINGQTIPVSAIPVTHEPGMDQLPWAELGVDLVFECTGQFGTREAAQGHIDAGAGQVLFSEPATSDVDATLVYGINQASLTGQEKILSNASCTTNCIVPVIKVLDDAFGVEQGHITTIHSAMNDQPVLDAYHHTDLRRTRSASQSIIPVETGLAKGIARIVPAFEGRFTATAVRVPTVNVSIMDLTVVVQRDTRVEEINQVLQQAAEAGPLAGILGYTDELLASCDFNHDPRSSIVDGGQTCVTGQRLVKVMAWFDNEWGFANRMLDVAAYLSDLKRSNIASSN